MSIFTFGHGQQLRLKAQNVILFFIRLFEYRRPNNIMMQTIDDVKNRNTVTVLDRIFG